MTHYDVLQVLPTASPEVIQMAYKALARKYHPDVCQGDREFVEFRMKRINEAYRILSNPALRDEYDRELLRAKEQRYQTYQQEQKQQTYQQNQSYQSSQPQREAPAKKANSISPLGFKALTLAIFLVFVLLSNVNLFDNNKSNNHQTSTTPKQTTPPATIIPRSGDILSGYEYFDGSELTITADSGSSYVVKLKTVSGVERLSFYVRAGETVTVGVPDEYLYVYFASGDTWYGKSRLFGEDTYYSMDDELLDFTQYTWEYTLYPVNSGNFSETPIDPNDF